ncbi:MAG: gamma-glutamylcyclotransferase [Thermoleophilia bacterium]|nr:gamma-glutamylcyclotransferase [Thermoleophilia bacterium]
MAEPPTYYFAYGSNLNRADMVTRCPSAKPLTTALLAGWRLTFRGVADVEPAVDRSVHGALWRLLDADVGALDRYEGAPSLYARRIVEVETESGPLEAMTYVMASDDYLGLPSAWYFERIARGYRDWGLPLDVLRAALAATGDELAGRGITRYLPDGRKRLRGVG